MGDSQDVAAANPTFSAAAIHQALLDAYPQVLTGELSAGLRLIAADVVDHRGGVAGDHQGRDAWREKWEHAATDGALRDMTTTVEQNVSAGDFSVNRYRFQGIDPATGRTASFIGIDMIRVANGQVVEHWAVLDTEAMRLQLDPERRASP